MGHSELLGRAGSRGQGELSPREGRQSLWQGWAGCEELIKHLSFLSPLPTFAALHEFPNDIFTNEDRRHGAVVLHVLCVSVVALLFSPAAVEEPGVLQSSD